MKAYLLDDTNLAIEIDLYGQCTRNTLDGIPCGTVDNVENGEAVVKVSIRENTGGAGTLSAGSNAIGAVMIADASSTGKRARVDFVGSITSAERGLHVVDTLNALVLGTTQGAAVVTDADGSQQQYLRGLVKLLGTSGIVLPSLPTGTNSIGTTKDGGAGWTTVLGVSGERFTSADQSGAIVAVTDAPTGGQKLVITDLIVSVDQNMRVDFRRESADTIELISVYLAANSVVNLITRGKFKLSTADKKLTVQTSAAGNIAVTALYYSEP